MNQLFYKFYTIYEFAMTYLLLSLLCINIKYKIYMNYIKKKLKIKMIKIILESFKILYYL
jgi:hypothetical protein